MSTRTRRLADHELMERIAAGDGAAASELFQRYGGAIYRYLRASGVSDDLAQDLTQEVFVTALSRAASYRGRGSLDGWLLRVARTRLIDEWRRNKARLTRETEFARGTDHQPCASEETVLLRSLLARLSVEDREVIVLSRFLDMSPDRTAEVLGLTAGAVRVRLHRALKRLTEKYAEVLGQ